jgi:hypothetical protein
MNESTVYDWNTRAWVPVQSEAWKTNFRPTPRRWMIVRLKWRGVWRTVRMASYVSGGPDRWITIGNTRYPVHLAHVR